MSCECSILEAGHQQVSFTPEVSGRCEDLALRVRIDKGETDHNKIWKQTCAGNFSPF